MAPEPNLPLSDAMDVSAAKGTAAVQARKPSAQILVVDDSAVQRHFLVDLLRRQGFDVRTAEDGLQAIARVRMHRPALIVMDVVMPGANGFQVTRALSRDPETRDIPVILCTTKDAETDRIWGLRQGARAYVTKPVDGRELLARITELLQ